VPRRPVRRRAEGHLRKRRVGDGIVVAAAGDGPDELDLRDDVDVLRGVEDREVALAEVVERKRVEAKIRLLSEELRQVSQVVTMGELTASLANDESQLDHSKWYCGDPQHPAVLGGFR